MANSRSTNNLVNIKPNRFFKSRIRNIRWESDIVKLIKNTDEQEGLIEEEIIKIDDVGTTTNQSSGGGTTSEKEFIESIEEQLNSNTSSL